MSNSIQQKQGKSMHRTLRHLLDKVRRTSGGVVKVAGGFAGRILPVAAWVVIGQLAFGAAPAQAQATHYIFNAVYNKCLVGIPEKGFSRSARVALASCDTSRAPARSEGWVMDANGQIEHPGLNRCLDGSTPLRVRLWSCDDKSHTTNQIWYRTNQQWIVYRLTQKCLDVSSDSSIRIGDCEDPRNVPNTDQRWQLIAPH